MKRGCTGSVHNSWMVLKNSLAFTAAWIGTEGEPIIWQPPDFPFFPLPRLGGRRYLTGPFTTSDDTRLARLGEVRRSQPDQTPKILHDRGQETLLHGSGQAPQLEPAEMKLLLEMSKEHFDFPALPGGPPE